VGIPNAVISQQGRAKMQAGGSFGVEFRQGLARDWQCMLV
jgi:hypothetical protein